METKINALQASPFRIYSHLTGLMDAHLLQTHICGTADTHMLHCRHTYVALQTHICCTADTHMWHCRRTYVAVQTHIRGTADTHMWHCRHTYVALQTHICGTAEKTTSIVTHIVCFLLTAYIFFGPGSSVGIATGYGLDDPGIESRWRRDFPRLCRPALGSTQPPVQWVPGLSRG